MAASKWWFSDLALVLRRLGDAADETARALGQQVFDRFCREMDRSLREMGSSAICPFRADEAYGRSLLRARRRLRCGARREGWRGTSRGGAAEPLAWGRRAAEAMAPLAEAADRLEFLSVTDLREGRFLPGRFGRHPRWEPGMSDTLPFSRPLDVSAIPATGVDRTITAGAAERAAIAEQYGIPVVRSLAAEFVVGREAGGVIRVEGRVTADIVQACVVSLEPVAQTIDEAVDIRLVEAGSRRAEALLRPAPELMIDPAKSSRCRSPRSPRWVDLGGIAVEHFLLAVDPYPRAPGAVLSADVAQTSGEMAELAVCGVCPIAQRISLTARKSGSSPLSRGAKLYLRASAEGVPCACRS